MTRLLLAGLLLPLLFRPASADGRAPFGVPASPSALCRAAIGAAERAGAIPDHLLAAIGRVESGRRDPETGRMAPWPWTINAEGAGQFFPTKAKAIAAVRTLQAQGVRSIDVGCMQINLLFHPDAFPSLEAAFDPAANTGYAARFLNGLYSDGRDWARAIGAFHSLTPVLADGYRTLVMARWQSPSLARTEMAHSAYRDFVAPTSIYSPTAAYAAFADPTRVYAAFARRKY